MKITDLRAKSAEELSGLVLDLKKEQFNLRMQAGAGALENKSRFKEVRRTIARAKTLLTEGKKPAKAAPKKAPAKKAKKG